MSSRTLALCVLLATALSSAEPCPVVPRTDRLDTVALKELAQRRLEARSEGYPFARVTIVAERDSSSWRLSCDEEPGERHLVAAPVNVDSSRSSDAVFARLAGWRAGRFWRPGALEEMERKVLRTGYFVPTAPARWRAVPRRNLLRPEFSMRDAPTATLRVDLATEEGRDLPSGVVAVEWLNLLGTARDLSFRYSSLSERLVAELSFREPPLFALGPALRVTAAVRSETDEFDSFCGEAALEWEGAVLGAALKAGGERVEERPAGGGGETRDSWWGSVEATADLRDPLPVAARGGRLGAEFSWRHSGSEDPWLLWSARWDWLTRVTPRALALRARGRVASRWPWRAGLRPESAYDWGGANSLRGYREQAFRSASYALFSLQPEWSPAASVAFFPFLDGAFDWALSAPGTEVRRWGWGAGARWSREGQTVGLAAGWPGANFSLTDAVLHLSWESRF